jgi:type IV secretory pathway VirB10-like protein
MLTKPIALVGLAAVMLAAGAGSYVAVRQNAAPIHQGDGTDATSIAQPAVITDAAEGRVVEATEATVEHGGRSGADDAERATSVATPASTSPERDAVAVPVAPTEPSAPPPAPEVRPSEPAPRTETPRSADAAPDASSARTSTNDTAVPPSSGRPGTETSSGAGSAPAVRDADDVREPAPAPVQDAPTERAAADLPAVEGWSRVESGPQETDAPAPLDAEPLLDERRRAIPPPAPMLVEYEIAADSVIGLQVETGVSTRTAEVEDSVEARVTRDVLVADEVAVPAGTRVLGSVVLVEQAGKLRDASRLGIRFHTLVMDEGFRVPIVTETIYREGDPKGRDSVGKIGGAAVGGAILGAIFGGARGAAIGGSIGAAGGTAAAVSTEAEPAGLPPGTTLTVRLSRPAIVTVEP